MKEWVWSSVKEQKYDSIRLDCFRKQKEEHCLEQYVCNTVCCPHKLWPWCPDWLWAPHTHSTDPTSASVSESVQMSDGTQIEQEVLVLSVKMKGVWKALCCCELPHTPATPSHINHRKHTLQLLTSRCPHGRRALDRPLCPLLGCNVSCGTQELLLDINKSKLFLDITLYRVGEKLCF